MPSEGGAALVPIIPRGGAAIVSLVTLGFGIEVILILVPQIQLGAWVEFSQIPL